MVLPKPLHGSAIDTRHVLEFSEFGDQLRVVGFRRAESQQTAAPLFKQLQPLRSERPPFHAALPSLARKGVMWVRPEIVAEVEFRGWTSNTVRHASFKGLRQGKGPREVMRKA